jgi:hypothetical protein
VQPGAATIPEWRGITLLAYSLHHFARKPLKK